MPYPRSIRDGGSQLMPPPLYQHQDLGHMPSSVSMDPMWKAEAEKEVDWADESDSERKSPAASLISTNQRRRDEVWKRLQEKKESNAFQNASPQSQSEKEMSPHVGFQSPQLKIHPQFPFTTQQALGTSGALIRFATGSTLLPQPIAELISNLSLLARVSLKSAAFFIEVLLEAAKYGTGMGLGLTRRALISAVGTARALHAIGNGEEWDAKAAGKSRNPRDRGLNDAFLSVLDKYTAVGIYVIHHTFTMAELFAMSSFYITHNSIKAGLSAADESVRMIDGIFGSNETSRALASFITLVKSEFTEDPRYATSGGISILANLTKAITAFAILQNSTYKRSAKMMKMRVMYDCTVMGEAETKSWRAMIVGPGNFVKGSRQLQPQQHQLEAAPQIAAIPPRSSSQFGSPRYEASGLPSPPASVHEPEQAKRWSASSSAPGSRPNGLSRVRSRAPFGSELCLTDLGPAFEENKKKASDWRNDAPSSLLSPDEPLFSSSADDEAAIIHDLEYFVGASEEDDPCEGVATSSSGGTILASTHLTQDELPQDMREALERYDEDELERGITVQQTQLPVGTSDIKHVIRKRPGRNTYETVYEITTETTETIETTTTIEDRGQRGGCGLTLTDLQRSSGLGLGSSTIERDVVTSHTGKETESVFDGGRETMMEEEDEWCEVARTINGTRSPDYGRLIEIQGDDSRGSSAFSRSNAVDNDIEISDIPEVPNGRPATGLLPDYSIGTLARRDAIEHPEESKARMQVVLKTMTRKLIQKRRVVRKIELGSEQDEDDDNEVRMSLEGSDVEGSVPKWEGKRGSAAGARLTTSGAKTAPSSPRMRNRTFADSQESRRKDGGNSRPRMESQGKKETARSPDLGSGFQRALNRARNTLRTGNSAVSNGNKGTPLITSMLGSGNSTGAPTVKTASAMSKSRVNSSLPKTSNPRPTLEPAFSIDSPNEARYSKQDSRALKEKVNGLPDASHMPPPSRDSRPTAHRTGLKSPRKGLAIEVSSRDSPRIPPRHGSGATNQWPLVQGEHGRHGTKGPSVTTTPSSPISSAPHAHSVKGSTRDNKRRSRAPSITSIHSFASRTHMQSTSTGPLQSNGASGGGTEAGSNVSANFPKAHLVHNLYKFMRHSSAAYGQNFMRILGIGSLDYFFPDTSKHHANVWAFAHHVGIPVDSILLNSFSEPTPFYSEKMSPIVNYVAVDDEAQAIVLTCRGTMGLSDILTDLTCSYEDILVEGARPHHSYQVHSGMLAQAQRLGAERSTVFQTLKTALEANPEYGLVITGHSLGGGIASLLAILWSCPSEVFQIKVLDMQRGMAGIPSRPIRHPKITTPFVTSLSSGLPPGRPIHAYAYGVPAVASPDLSKHTKGLITSVVHSNDFVPTLSLGTVRDMKNVAHSLSDEKEADMAQEIVGRVIGLYQRSRRSKQEGAKGISVGAPPPQLYDPMHIDSPRPQEIPSHERELLIDIEELAEGRTKNRAEEAGYKDPTLSEDYDSPYSRAWNANSGSQGATNARAAAASATQSKGEAVDDDEEIHDWLWSLIKTMRADMNEAKLYPPGHVYCIESFAVFVTPRTNGKSSSMSTGEGERYSNVQEEQMSSSRAEAHRVILRYCENVEKRFSEPVFSRSMLRDHIPTNYELCMSLLYQSVMPRNDPTWKD
ncbi:hypothetical protein IE53DRAFT_369064 [Violaceomyces palustris]|uniref:Uncharacterized protein n=1 Tax=Violaceomyces palustris TaxID=1673888 RepID=A0ACD0NWZ8_9BASI|nr:hypothetical protein IE53DRAFT_369064 [Violaceomyces palustris]